MTEGGGGGEGGDGEKKERGLHSTKIGFGCVLHMMPGEEGLLINIFSLFVLRRAKAVCPATRSSMSPNLSFMALLNKSVFT